jgi:hypothetical protein
VSSLSTVPENTLRFVDSGIKVWLTAIANSGNLTEKAVHEAKKTLEKLAMYSDSSSGKGKGKGGSGNGSGAGVLIGMSYQRLI